MAYMDVLKFIISSDYWEGLAAVPIVMMAEIFMGIYFNLSFWYKLSDQTYWGAIISAIGCAVLLAINFLLVPKIGYMACAWGGFAGYGICMVLSYLIGRKKNPVPYKLMPIIGYFALAVGIFLASKYMKEFLYPESTIITLIVNTLLLLVYIAVVIYNERTLVKGVVSGIKRKILKR